MRAYASEFLRRARKFSGNSDATACARSQQILATHATIHPRSGAYTPYICLSYAPIGVCGAGDCYREFPRMSLLETVWKILSTSQSPYHQPRHRQVDERFSGDAHPLVVLAHAPVLT